MIAILSMSLAHAQAPEERWDDGLTARPPVSLGVHATGAAIAPRPAVGFGELGVGYGLHLNEGIVLGATVDARMFGTSAGVGFQRADAEAWIVFIGDGFVHGLSIGTGGTLDLDGNRVADAPTGYFQFHPYETGGVWATRYVMVASRGRVDWVLEGRLGIAEATVALATTSLAAIAEVGPGLAVSAGLEVGYAPFGTFAAGVHARPLPNLEIGGGLATALPILDLGQPGRFEIDPSLSVKLYR